jgi:TRAP-type C4-dicarboxylate transport system permease small subunit
MPIIRQLLKICQMMSAAVLIVVLIIDFVGVVLRYGFNYAFQWSEEVQVFGLIWIVFLSVGILAYKDEHLTTDVIKNYLTVSIKRFLTVFKLLIIWVTSFLMIVGGVKVVINSFHISQVSTGSNFPMWLMYSAPAVGYCLGGLGYIKSLRDLLKTVAGKIPQGKGE